MKKLWDCIVVDACAAGLSAALVLGRALQRTLVIDAGGQSNRDAHGIGGLLGHDGRPPAAFYAAGRDELAAYPTVELRSDEVLGGERHDAGFVLELGDGSREAARHVLLTTGMDYRFPALPGIAERWGLGVPLPVLPWLGGPRPAARSTRPGCPRVCSGRSCCASGATT